MPSSSRSAAKRATFASKTSVSMTSKGVPYVRARSSAATPPRISPARSVCMQHVDRAVESTFFDVAIHEFGNEVADAAAARELRAHQRGRTVERRQIEKAHLLALVRRER